jgi:ATP-dependent RNA helicase DeaD
VRDDRPRDDRPARPTRAAHRDLAEWSPPAEADDERPILARGASPAAAAPKPAVPAVSAAPVAPAVDGEGEATIFVNVGRRDGVQPGDLIQTIAERAQIDPASIGRVRLRDRNAFVDVAPAQLAHIVETLKGAVLGGRVVNAEPARPRSEGGAASAEGSNPTGGEAR